MNCLCLVEFNGTIKEVCQGPHVCIPETPSKAILSFKTGFEIFLLFLQENENFGLWRETDRDRETDYFHTEPLSNTKSKPCMKTNTCSGNLRTMMWTHDNIKDPVNSMTSEPCAQSQTSLQKIRVGPAWFVGMCGLNCTGSFNYHSLSIFLNILIQKQSRSVSQVSVDPWLVLPMFWPHSSVLVNQMPVLAEN